MAPPPTFESLYEEHFAFVWRTLARLGVRESALDDAVQDVFLVVHRRLADFEGRSTARGWLAGIARRVARDHRRRAARKGAAPLASPVADGRPGPFDVTARNEARRRLHAILDELDEAKREVFVLAELERMAAPAIAEALGLKVNTVYSRLREARRAFERAVARRRARDERGSHER